jgi:hypothetical protein
MKPTDNFKKVIQQHLEGIAANDVLFAETLKKPNKSLDECINYIFDTVKKSGCNGFEDQEIFAMAVHYYDEDDIKATSKIQAKVIVNHAVQLSQEDLEDAKKQAMERVIEEAKKDIKLPKIKLNEKDMAEAKTIAMNLAVAEAQKKIFEKKKPVSKPITGNTDEVEEPTQGSLF